MKELFFSKKYIFSKRGLSFVPLINKLSLLGIIVGVLALNFVISILGGFQDLNYQQLTGFDSHILIENNDDNSINFNQFNEVKRVDTVGLSKAIISYNNLNSVVDIYAINFNYLNDLGQFVYYGNKTIDKNEVLIGNKLSKSININLEDNISLITVNQLEKSLRTYNLSNINQLKLTGVFHSNIQDYDRKRVIMNLSDFNRIFEINKNLISLNLYNFNKAEEVKNEILKIYPKLKITTWIDTHSDFYNIMQFEKYMTFSVISIIIILAIFGLMASLSMTVVQKRKDIFILNILGMEKKSISKIFIYEGIIIGLIGAVVGSILYLLLYYLQLNIGLFKFGSNIMLNQAFPVVFDFKIFLSVFLITIFLSYLATILPVKSISDNMERSF